VLRARSNAYERLVAAEAAAAERNGTLGL